MDADALRRRRWLTVVVMMATIMQALDGTIANVALPNIQGSLSSTQEQVAWVITSYIVSAAIATPLAGFCAVRFGVRRILVSSVIGFTIASMLCGRPRRCRSSCCSASCRASAAPRWYRSARH